MKSEKRSGSKCNFVVDYLVRETLGFPPPIRWSVGCHQRQHSRGAITTLTLTDIINIDIMEQLLTSTYCVSCPFQPTLEDIQPLLPILSVPSYPTTSSCVMSECVLGVRFWSAMSPHPQVFLFAHQYSGGLNVTIGREISKVPDGSPQDNPQRKPSTL